MFNKTLLSNVPDETLKKTRLITGIVFLLFYIIMYALAFGIGKVDMARYNQVLLSLSPAEFNTFFAEINAQGSFFIFQVAHFIDLAFVLVYTPFFLAVTELSKRTSVPEKKHWKAAGLFSLLICIIPFTDLFETGTLHIAILQYPSIPDLTFHLHFFGKIVEMLFFYPIIGWFIYLAVRALVRQIRKKKQVA